MPQVPNYKHMPLSSNSMNIPPLFVRVIGSTRYPERHQEKSLVGQAPLEVRTIDHEYERLSVWNGDKSSLGIFNFSDVQIVFPECVVDGYVLGVGDKIDGETVVNVFRSALQTRISTENFDGGSEYNFNGLKLSQITPLYPSEDTIEVNGKTYKKVDVLERLSELKPVK